MFAVEISMFKFATDRNTLFYFTSEISFPYLVSKGLRDCFLMEFLDDWALIREIRLQSLATRGSCRFEYFLCWIC